MTLGDYINFVITNVFQRDIYDKSGVRTDVYYQEGQGALFVREGDELTPGNVIMSVPYEVLRFYA